MLRPSFVPPAEIRVLRDYTRMRMDLTRERTRHYARLEKLLEDALMKVSAVAAISWSSISSVNNSRRSRRASGSRSSFFFCLVMLTVNLLQIWTTPLHRPSDTPSWARVLLDQIDSLSEQVARLSTRIEELIAAIPAAQGVDAHGTTGPNARLGPDAAALPALDRLDEITGIGRHTAQVIIAEIGLDMTRFPSPEHVASWAKLSPSTIQSGAKSRSGGTGKGNPYIKGALGEAAAAAARTDTFLGERYRRKRALRT